MNFEVDRHSSAWANIALCADLTWTTESPDDFVIANQRLWNQHCRVSKVLKNTIDNPTKVTLNDQFELTDRREKRPNTIQNEENTAAVSPKSVKDIIPESRLARFYGNFYYDEHREKSYINGNEKVSRRCVNSHDCDNSDITECWMLPEVEYLFRKLTDEANECAMRRRRPYSSRPDDFITNYYRSAASERWSSEVAESEAAEASLARRVRAVRALWDPGPALQAADGAPSPPATPRKMRARRRQPRRSTHYTPPPTPRYCLDGRTPAPLICDPSYKFQFDAPRPPQMTKCQRAMARFSASVQVAMHASRARLSRCRPLLGRFAAAPSRISPRSELCSSQRPAPESSRRDETRSDTPPRSPAKRDDPTPGTSNILGEIMASKGRPHEYVSSDADASSSFVSFERRGAALQCNAMSTDNTYKPSPSSTNTASVDEGSRTRRLYSTVLSMSAPRPLGLAPGVVRLSQKQMAPGLLKLNPKIILPVTRFRTTTVDKKFDELEKEALEQYKTSDESIDTKFRELEKQAVEQYKVSNSDTSCSSGNSGEKCTKNSSPTAPTSVAEQIPYSISKVESAKKSVTKFHKDKIVGSVVIHSQNFPVLDTKGQKSSVLNLKNFPLPQRGEKKQQGHKPRKNPRNFKSDSSYAASDTDYEARAALKSGHKVPVRWGGHVAPPKKRMKKNVTVCVSELLLDREPLAPITAAIRDLASSRDHAVCRAKMSAHGAGDLEPAFRKT
ncbi:hypothetical protein EVAR_81381_1 [Eumeta japonica]|uniref:Uncharacterized protein n=1 Tax=Eumeta variegata TaxID=151549 RepID=A0A4C1WGX4_EUMVA|nr:hypothetical protein EVAR_81381_1 [Eumeta japonica]